MLFFVPQLVSAVKSVLKNDPYKREKLYTFDIPGVGFSSAPELQIELAKKEIGKMTKVTYNMFSYIPRAFCVRLLIFCPANNSLINHNINSCLSQIKYSSVGRSASLV